ncbi:hypothetical protein INS49_012871 [Diaporthe citri]|uniref:uncharacterized protein n=1 Tax=Diaporthe citri TaxID=83186 RepID=UPI001C815205|nr:uncharacterized protein INS49_012871 [Diaporthe citri]KAG6359350.1 hypothetical protein INS49_012871 [Diaporthe citri]
MGIIFSAISQAFPPKPSFTEKDIGNLSGKVYIVTGANTGLGKEIAQILYSKDAKVYCAARSREKAQGAINAIKAAWPNSRGQLIFLPLDLADLSTIKASAEDFLSKEDRLHVLFNNAGVMKPPNGSKTAQGYELQLGVNNLGTFLFTKLLTPTLARTARAEDPSSVRVVWVSSSAAESIQVPSGGVDLSNLDYHVDKSPFDKYCVSKAGNYLQGVEFARRHKEDGIVSIPLNPGNLNSDLWRSFGSGAQGFLRSFVLHPPILGAYTQLFAAFSPQVSIERSGEWVVPWGRFMKIRQHLLDGSKPVSEGGNGTAEKFWEWSEEQVKPFL